MYYELIQLDPIDETWGVYFEYFGDRLLYTITSLYTVMVNFVACYKLLDVPNVHLYTSACMIKRNLKVIQGHVWKVPITSHSFVLVEIFQSGNSA